MMNKIFVLALLLISSSIFAQQKDCLIVEWSKNYGGSKSEGANDMKRTPDGGYILAGYARSQDQDLDDNNGLADFWVVKLDSLGDLEWQRHFGGQENDIAAAVELTQDGGYIVAGGTVSFDGDVVGNHGAEDAWVIRLNQSGNLVWKKTFGGTQNERAEGISSTSDGGFIVSGYSQSADGDVSQNYGEFDYWLFKIDGNGTLIWDKNLGGTLSEYAFDAVQTIDGGYLVTGSSFSEDVDLTGNLGFYDTWVVKLSSSLNIEWQKNLGGVGEERSYEIGLHAGGVYVAGTSNSSGGNLPGSNGSYDFWILSLDFDGTILWSKNFGGTAEDRAFGVFPKQAGGVLVCGLTASINNNVSNNYGVNDAWLLNLDIDGNLIWEKNFGGSLDDRFYTVLELAEGGYACSGFSTSSNFDVTDNNGEQDMWIVRLTADSIEISLGNDTLLCAGQGVILSPSIVDTVDYLWPDGSNLPVFLVTSPGEYWVEVNREGCISRDTLVVDYVSELPVNLGVDTVLCAGEGITLDPGILGAIVFWSTGSTEPTITVEKDGVYWAEVSKDGCDYLDTIIVSFTEVPIDLGQDLAICEGEHVTLNAELPNAVYNWNQGEDSPILEVSTPGIYWVDVKIGNCVESDTIEIKVQEGPVDPLPTEGFICEDEGIWLSAEFEGASQYLWEDGTTTPQHKAVKPGNYSVEVTVNSCLFRDTLELKACELCLYIPNAITPNGDGINDVFMGYQGCPIKNYNLKVFDRWGELLFESYSPELGWDGEINGRKAISGSYVYVVDFDYEDFDTTNHISRRGDFVILR